MNGPSRCVITIDAKEGVNITWDPCLPDGPHKLGFVETAAAGAILGIGKALTGKGSIQVLQAMKLFERSKA